MSNPDAIIYFIEANSALGSAESHAAAFLNPAVDMVTTSYGISFALGLLPSPEYRAFEHSYEGVVLGGKLHFSSGGNGPGITALRGGAGPWWSIGVSGIQEGESEGDTVLSGNLPDFVSDFTQTLPYCMDCQSGMTRVSGTSFSTPRSAGLASKWAAANATMRFFYAHRVQERDPTIAHEQLEAALAVDPGDGDLLKWCLLAALDEEQYEMETAAGAFNRQRYPDLDPYQDAFNEIANDLAAAQLKLSGDDRPLVERIVAPAVVSLPVTRGQRLGTVRVYARGKLLGERPLVAAESLTRPGLGGKLRWYATRTLSNALGLFT